MVFQVESSKWSDNIDKSDYKSKQGAEKGVAAVKKSANENNFDYRTSQADQPYFVLKAANGEVIGTSQMYRRLAGCEKGARAVVNNAADAVIEVN